MFPPPVVMQVLPVTLEGQVARLESLRLDHAAGLLETCSFDLFSLLFTRPASWTLPDLQTYLRFHLAKKDNCPFAIIDRQTQKAIGVTMYMTIRPEHFGLEIGTTWIARAVQGTQVNPECKYMLLRHAFENIGAIRVELKTDLRNLQSQRAIEKLGAKKEAVLRKERILPDGHIRDTVVYSILDTEWAEVKERLEARLGYIPGTGTL